MNSMKKIKIKFVDGPTINIEQLRESGDVNPNKDGQEIDYNNNEIFCWLKERYDVEFSDDPEYLFYSVYSDNFLNYDCIRIFYTGEAQTPDFNLCDYAIGFDNIEFGDRYFRYPLVNSYYPGEIIDQVQKKRNFTIDDLKKKKRFCDYIYSNDKGDNYRTQILLKLSRYKEVASAGKHLNNIGYRVRDKIAFQGESKFSIAFENALFDGYTTEKIGDPFVAGSIPIYWGNPSVANQFNSNAFVNCHDFRDINEVIKRVIEIDQNDDLYIQIMNEPIYSNDYKWKECEQNCKSFIYNIIEQPYQSAFRRNRGFWGDVYESSMKDKKLKYRAYYNLLNKWIYKYGNNELTEKYFVTNNINNIAIYGTGEIGKILFNELRYSTKVNIRLLIDRKRSKIFGNEDVFSINDDISNEIISKNIELIVITAIYSYKEIKKELQEKTCVKIVSLEEIIDF